MPLSDRDLEELIALGATDDEIEALDRESDSVQASVSSVSKKQPLGTAFTQALPGSAIIPDIQRGQYFGRDESENIGRVAGDLSALAGTGAAAATMGALPVAGTIAAGALANEALEQTGWNPYFRNLAERHTRSAPAVPFVESPNPIVRALQYGKGMAQAAPDIAASTIWGLVPSLTAAAATGAGMLGVGRGAARLADAPVNAPGAAGMLQEAGGRVTPAMVRAAQGKEGGLAAGVESVSRANPLTSGLTQRIDKANAAAIQKTLGAEVPGATLTPSTAGGLLESVLEKFQGRRGTAVKSAKDALRELNAGDVGKAASDKIIKQLREGGVPMDESGFRPDLMTGKEKMPASTASALVEAERNLRGATMAEAINFLENFDDAVRGKLSATYGYKATSAVKEARALIKQTIVEKAREVDSSLAKALTDADRAYSVSQPTVKAALQKSRGETPTSQLVQSVFGRAGSKADKGLRRLQSTMTPEEFGVVQDALASELVSQATGTKGLSITKLDSAIKAMGENVRYLKPEAVAGLQKVREMMRVANIAELEMPNPPGTAQRLTQNILSPNPLNVAAGAGAGILAPSATLGAAAAGLGASGLSAAYLKLPQIQRALMMKAQPAASAFGRALQGIPPQTAARAAAVPSLAASLEQARTRGR